MQVKSNDCVDVGEKLARNSISLRHLAPMQQSALRDWTRHTACHGAHPHECQKNNKKR